MHSLRIFTVLLITAVQASDELEYQVIHVTYGQSFTLHCFLTGNGTCAWQRNGSVVKPDAQRYSSKEVNLANGKNCTFHATEAEVKSDFGNWTCGEKANDYHSGKIFKNILVNVNKNDPLANSTNSAENNASNGSNETLHIIIGALSAVLFLFVLVALICYFKNGGKLKKAKSPTSSLHEYEEIDANYSSLPNPNPTHANNPNLPNTNQPKPNCQAITLKIGNTETTIPITDIFEGNGYEMPLSKGKPKLSRSDSGATFKLIAVRQPTEQSQRNSTTFQDGVHLPKHKKHDYQNIRTT